MTKASCAVLTISDTRTAQTDLSGRAAAELLEGAGHDVVIREILPDDVERVRARVLDLAGRADVDAILLNGGTGISPRDGTYEAVASLLDRRLEGFGEIFRRLSFDEIGSSAMLSRAVGGLVGGKILFSMPGSPAAVRLAMERLIVPELGHLISEARKGKG